MESCAGYWHSFRHSGWSILSFLTCIYDSCSPPPHHVSHLGPLIIAFQGVQGKGPWGLRGACV